MTQEDTALQAAWEEWLAAHPDRSTAGPVYRPGFEAGWAASRQVIDSLTAERAQSASEHFRQTATTNAILVRLADMLARAEAAEAEVKRLREALVESSGALTALLDLINDNDDWRTSGQIHGTWSVQATNARSALETASAALATPPSEGGQS